MRRSRFLSGASGCLLACAFLALTWVGTAAAQSTTETFAFTGGAQSFRVPENVCEITVDAFGAEGGDGDLDNTVRGEGGLGGEASALLTVTPGESLQVMVGGQGGTGTGGPLAGTVGAGGFYGGGTGGAGVGATAGFPLAAGAEPPTFAAMPRSCSLPAAAVAAEQEGSLPSRVTEGWGVLRDGRREHPVRRHW